MILLKNNNLLFAFYNFTLAHSQKYHMFHVKRSILDYNIKKIRFYSTLKKNRYVNVYTELKYFVDNNPVNIDSQMKIERFLLDNGVNTTTPDEIGGIFNGLYSKKTSELLLKFKPDLSRKISNFMKFKDQYKADSSAKAKNKLVLTKIIDKVGSVFVITILFGRFLKIVSNSRKDFNYEKNLALRIALDISKDLIRKYLSLSYKEDKQNIKDNDVFTFSDWKKSNSSWVNELEDSSLQVNIGVMLIEWLEDCNLITKKLVKLNKAQHNYYQSPEDVSNDLDEAFTYEYFVTSDESKSLLNTKKNMLLTSCLRLPCIVKPKLYKYENNRVVLGGYYYNDVEYTDPLLLKTHEQSEETLIHKPEKIYNLINNINSIGYKINSTLLNFILMNHWLYKDELVPETHELEGKKKLNKKEKVELQKYLSKFDLQNHILNIANIFLNIPEFYFINRIDSRGRLYCITEYLNYQSTDLAKALLLFSKPNKIRRFGDEMGILYFKAYGANCYGNKLDKESLCTKENWVKLNRDRIINYENGDIIQEAEHKLLFTAFCIEYKKWWNFNCNSTDQFFYTYLPIQLDASCNGFQHLVLLSGEENLRKELNLTESKISNKPYDFYSYILELFKEYLKNEDYSKLDPETRERFDRIKVFSLDRSIVKKVIMTIPYNASTRKMVGYITELLIKDDSSKSISENNSDKIWFSHPEDTSKSNKLEYKDLYLLVSKIKDLLDRTAPKIAKLKQYLKDIASICTKLELHIPWLLPTGLEVRQSYLKEKSVELKPFSYLNTKIKLSTFTNELDLNRQVRAFMPNLIHSLDACTMMELLEDYFNNKEFEVKNIYTIHDCFALPMNHVESIIDSLRMVYISVYSKSVYLEELDKHVLNNIKSHYRKVNYDRQTNKLTVTIDSRVLTFNYPNVKEVLGNELPKLDNDIEYIIM